jgi:hypothetical protein
LATRGYLERPAISKRLMDLALIDTPVRVMADAVSTTVEHPSHQSISQWLTRHKAELDAARAIVSSAVVNAAVQDGIAAKVTRIRELNGWYTATKDIADTRGLIATETKVIGSGDSAREVQVERYDAAMVAQARGLLRDAAEEVGDIVRPTAGINVERMQVNVYLGGASLDAPALPPANPAG